MFTAAFAGFVVTSALCGLAASAGQLIAFRGLQGLAAALLAPQVLATIQIVLPPERRTRAYAAQGAVLSLAAMSGPAIAGLLVAANILGSSWRPIFLINVPIGIVAIILGFRLIPTVRSPSAKRLDIPGVLLVMLALVSLMVPLTLGALNGWPLWAWLGLVLVPGLGWLFLWSQRLQESRGRSPLLPTGLWRDRAFRLGILLYLLVFSGITAFYLFYFILIQRGYGVSPLLAAISVMPSGLATLVFSLASWRFVRRWGGRRIVAIGAATSGLGFLSLLVPVTQVADASVAVWTIPSQLVVGTGFGLLLAPLLSVVLAGIRSAEAGAAAGLLTTAQIMGGAFGVGVNGLLFQSQLPGTIDLASTGELVAGMTRSLLYNPVVFVLVLAVVAVLPSPPARVGAHA